jgi:hypothetical protein
MTEKTLVSREDHAVEIRRRFRRGVVAVAALALLLGGCKKAAEPGPKSFASMEAAEKAVYDAAKAGDRDAVLVIFGPDVKDLLVTDDPAQDKATLDAFATAYEKMHRWGKLATGGMVLTVGVQNYPFPFPLVQKTDGTWSFDAEAGKKEMLARQIGSNELTVLDVLNAMADAQAEYYSAPRDGSKVRQYAQKILSSEGKHDGLYWKVAEGEAESPLGPLAARASAEGYKGAGEPFHGYFYRILAQQGARAQGGAKNYLVKGKMTGGFAILAFPANYRRTGVMTFLMGPNRIVYQKDLGQDTLPSAQAIPSFDPDETWSVVQ